VIFLSASDRLEDKALAFQYGAMDYITKPFQFDEVRMRVEVRLKTHGLEQTQRQNAIRLEELVRARTQQVEGSRLEILHRLAIAGDYRDSSTGKHTVRVGRLSAQLAQTLGLPDDETELIRLSAPLHDIGKIGIPDRILLSRRKFSVREFNTMKSHVLIGSKILSGGTSPLVQMAELIANYHHERWDGSGYCLGLKGDAIPRAARIVAVADVFDALTHERPYKLAWSRDVTMAEMERQRGKQFDPEVVSALCALVSRDVIEADQNDVLPEQRRITPGMA
jgi:putative two-component system response regulator